MRSPPVDEYRPGVRAALAERRAHRLHHGLARPERVLVAAQADHPRRDGLERRFERRPQAGFAAASANPRPGQRRCRPDARCLNESPSRERHACLLPNPCCPCDPWRYLPAVVVTGRSTLRKTAVAFFISSMVPSEMRACVFSSGGNVAADHDPLRGAGVAEGVGWPADVHEEEVALRVAATCSRDRRAP